MHAPPSVPLGLQFVAIGGEAYPHEMWLAAVNTVALERLERSIPEGATVRRIGRALAAMRTLEAASAIRAEAASRLLRQTTPVVTLPPGAVVVARFPAA